MAPTPEGERKQLTGWGRTAPSVAHVVPASTGDDVKRVASEPLRRGVLGRGLGRSYNDAATNGGGIVLDMTAAVEPFELDRDTGILTVGAGVSLGEVIERSLPAGWFPPVTPGTQHVTVGGAIAADVHGKNHHADGSFGFFVDSIRVWTPATGVVSVSRDQDADLFWATVGGMGLTGVIVDATVRLRQVETASMVVDTDRVPDVDSLMQMMTEEDERYPYSVAWIDCQVGGRHLGRSVLTRGRHATLDDLATRDPIVSLQPSPPRVFPAPPWVPSGLINRLTVRAFNAMWYRKAPRRRRDELQGYRAFFYPLDQVRAWNRLYGTHGFIQYQFVVPPEQGHAVHTALELLSAWDAASFLAVLKRFGPGTEGHLSFPRPGWTLALDLPVARQGLADLLDRLDEVVMEAGGRVYLAKDGRLRPELVPEMYPRIDDWRAVRDRFDPDGVMQSDLDRRLDLTGKGVRA